MQQTIALLLAYKYLIIAPLAIFEGPILAVVCGFLATLGALNIFIVYGLLVFGDIIGDSMFYGLGRWGGPFIHKHGQRIGPTPEVIKKGHDFLQQKHRRAIVLSKVIHGAGIAGLVAAGSARIPYFTYIRMCLVVTFPQAAILSGLGLFFGSAYQQVGKYLDVYAAVVSVIVLGGVAFFIFKRIRFS